MQATITLREAKGCVPEISDDEITTKVGRRVTWRVVNQCRQTRTVILRGLPPHVTGRLRADDIPGNGGEGWIVGRASEKHDPPGKKYDVHVLDGGVLDPYIVIEDVRLTPALGMLAVVAGIAVGYLTYRTVGFLIDNDKSRRQLQP